MSVIDAISEVQTWSVEDGLLESPAVTNRNLFAHKFKEEDPNTILRQYAYFNCQEIDEFYSSVFDLIPEVQLSGVGLELGAGTGGFSSAVCNKFADIDNIYAVEVVPDVVSCCSRKPLPAFAANMHGRSKESLVPLTFLNSMMNPSTSVWRLRRYTIAMILSSPSGRWPG